MAGLTYDATADAVRGSFESADASERSVSISCDGEHWATVSGFADGRSPNSSEYACALEPVAFATTSLVEARVRDGTRIASARIERQPLANASGLLAHDVFGSDHHPFLAIPWLTFDGACITVSGMHLPPEGDPAKLDVTFAPGVSYDLQYGLRSPEFRSHYWYWPNSDLSGLILTIDVAASERYSNPFHFRFVSSSAGGLGGAKRSVDVWLPTSFESYRGFPADARQLTRVQSYSTSASVAVSGFSAFRTLEELFARAGIEGGDGPAILDWGCGHGRVTCHFIDGWPNARVYGTDIDAENVAWCDAHLARDRFAVSPLWPPAPFADGTFDGVFGISVMTHLTADAQRAWFAELARILKPGGVALLTFQSEGYAAFGSVWRDPAWWSRWRETGFDDEQLDPALDGKIADDRYYRNTAQSVQSFVEECSRDFELLWIEPAIFGGYQDCAGLRRR